MTTISEALNRIARQCSMSAPSSWVTATRADHVELRDDFLQETVSDIADRVDAPAPISKAQTLTGGSGTTNADGSETFALNSDFLRLQRNALAVYDPQQDRPVIPITSDGRWDLLTDTGATGVIKYYQTAGYEGAFTMTLYNGPATGDTYQVNYITNLWMADASGTVGSLFTAETDILLFPRRLVETGTVWRARERRGLPYLDKYNEYEALMTRFANDRRGRRVVHMGEPARDVRWQDLVPAFIPPGP